MLLHSDPFPSRQGKGLLRENVKASFKAPMNEPSSDEELEEAYANIEVNFDESETEEEEEYEVPTKDFADKVAGFEMRPTCQEGPHDIDILMDHPPKYPFKNPCYGDFAESTDVPELEECGMDILDDEDDYVPHPSLHLEEVPVSHGKSYLLDLDALGPAVGENTPSIPGHPPPVVDHHYHGPPDIDLEDPAVVAAATKIQSVFKGFQARKNLPKPIEL